MVLQEAHDGIDQIGKQNRKQKDDDYSPRDIDDGDRERERKNRNEYLCGAAVKYAHGTLLARPLIGIAPIGFPSSA